MMLQGLDEESRGGAALDAAGAQDAPDTLAPGLTGYSPCALRGLAVLHHEAERLLDEVVGGLDPRVLQERKVLRAMVAEAVGQGLGVGRGRGAAGDPQNLIPRPLQRPPGLLRAQGRFPVDRVE